MRRILTPKELSNLFVVIILLSGVFVLVSNVIFSILWYLDIPPNLYWFFTIFLPNLANFIRIALPNDGYYMDHQIWDLRNSSKFWKFSNSQNWPETHGRSHFGVNLASDYDSTTNSAGPEIFQNIFADLKFAENFDYDLGKDLGIRKFANSEFLKFHEILDLGKKLGIRNFAENGFENLEFFESSNSAEFGSRDFSGLGKGKNMKYYRNTETFLGKNWNFVESFGEDIFEEVVTSSGSNKAPGQHNRLIAAASNGVGDVHSGSDSGQGIFNFLVPSGPSTILQYVTPNLVVNNPVVVEQLDDLINEIPTAFEGIIRSEFLKSSVWDLTSVEVYYGDEISVGIRDFSFNFIDSIISLGKVTIIGKIGDFTVVEAELVDEFKVSANLELLGRNLVMRNVKFTYNQGSFDKFEFWNTEKVIKPFVTKDFPVVFKEFNTFSNLIPVEKELTVNLINFEEYFYCLNKFEYDFELGPPPWIIFTCLYLLNIAIVVGGLLWFMIGVTFGLKSIFLIFYLIWYVTRKC